MIILNCQVEGIASRRDSTWKITLGTQELRDASELTKLSNKLVTVGINDKDLTKKEIDLIAGNKFPIESVPNQKSTSKRLRNVLYILGRQKGVEDDEQHYQEMMNQIIEFYKSKLD